MICPLLLLLVTAAASAQPARPPANPCHGDPVYRQFDFWAGEWDVYNPQEQKVGENTITIEQNGCVLVEHWTAASGGTGTSINYYDPQEKAWKQVWVDARGSLGYFSGGLESDAMVLDGRWVNRDGSSFRLRGTWTPLDDGRVRQHFEQSTDDGQTWSTWFDGYYVKR